MSEYGPELMDILTGAAALPEERMRVEFLGDRLKVLEPAAIAGFFDMLYRLGPRHPAAVKVRMVLVDPAPVEAALGRDLCRKVYLASLKLGLKRVSRLFTDLPPKKRGLAGYDKEEEARMEHLTLGQRRALSRSGIKDDLDRLLSDPDPVVISNILENPRITEREVLKIASKRPNSPEILTLVARHRTWSRRYAVAKAVAFNPYSPPRVAIALVEHLRIRDARAAANDPTLHPQVRMAAREAVQEREGG